MFSVDLHFKCDICMKCVNCVEKIEYLILKIIKYLHNKGVSKDD